MPLRIGGAEDAAAFPMGGLKSTLRALTAIGSGGTAGRAKATG